MQLSKTENKIYETLKNAGFVLFTVRDICQLLSMNKTKVYNLIKALKKKGVIKKVGVYFFFSDADDFVTGNILHFPSYLSLWSALQYYGMSDQMPKKIFFITTKYRKPIKNFVYVTVASYRYFGYQKIGSLTIAEREKAIVDGLFFPRYCGGIAEIYKSIREGWMGFDKNKLVSYALQMRSKAVLRRLGYILEQCGEKKEFINKLKMHIGTGYELLDPTCTKKNNFNEQWFLDINVNIHRASKNEITK